MKMNNKHAFSLAEAMITLLIVCLITLASIPVITKKKRTPDTSAHGAYYCTRVYDEATKLYKYVHYSTSNPVGDRDNPNTWEAVGEGADRCSFTPPINAKNFAVTIIGGGGAGARGVSDIETKLGTDKPTFTPTEEREYQLAMVGGGGGGAAGWHDSVVGGSGGAAGGFHFSKIKLKPEKTYSFKLGSFGGKGNTDLDDDNPGRATSGGNTEFLVKDGTGANEDWKTIYTATGGQGGQNRECDYDCGSKSCNGGNASIGGTITKNNSLASSVITSQREVIEGKGSPGSNDCAGVNPVTNKCPSSNYKTVAGEGSLFDGNNFGSGGKGCYRGKTCHEDGSAGHFSLGLINIFGGGGGHAATPLIVPVPKIPGRMDMTVGLGGESVADGDDNKGERSIVKIYNRANIQISSYAAEGGDAGTETKQRNATAGENSLWSDKGGGTVGQCYDRVPAHTVLEDQQVDKETGKCLKIVGMGSKQPDPNKYDINMYKTKWVAALDPSNKNSNKWATGPVPGQGQQQIPPNQNTASVCMINSLVVDDRDLDYTLWHHRSIYDGGLGYHVGNVGTSNVFCLNVWYCSPTRAIAALKSGENPYYVSSPTETATQAINNLRYGTDGNFVCMFEPASNDATMNQYRTKMNNEDMSTADYNRLWVLINTMTDFKYKYRYMTMWSADSEFKFACLQPEVQKVTEKVPVTVAEEPARCDNSGAGTSFGAGGGGGAASDTIGVYGLGGKGAPGAVIVEW